MLIKSILKKVFPRLYGLFRQQNELEEQLNTLRTQNERMLQQLEELKKQNKRLHTEFLEYMDPSLYPHAVKQWYQDITGSVLDLNDPRTYNEKIQWMKVYDPDPRKTLLADKLAVRKWVAERIGEEYLIPLIGVYRRAEEIDFTELPDSFVLKANHGCDMNALIREKKVEDLEALREKASGWLKTNYAFRFGFEMQYNDIPRCLLVEEYMQNGESSLNDYKFWCFDGKTRFIQLIKDRGKDTRMALYDLDWQRLPYSTGAFPAIEKPVEQPEKLPEMIRLAETLAEGFPHVRVDLYLLDNGEIKFGELTFTTSSGVTPWEPPEADLWVGDMFKLPERKGS